MTEEQLKEIWQSANNQNETINFHSLNLKEMNQQIKKFEKTIASRNNREIGAAILIIAGFGYYAFIIPTLLGKLGAIWTIGYGIWVIYKLKKVEAKQPGFNIEHSIKQQLVDYQKYVKSEQRLLENILYWYLLPILPGMVLFLLGIEKEWSDLLVGLSCMLIIFIAVYLLNKEAAEKQFTPLLTDIEETLQRLEQTT